MSFRIDLDFTSFKQFEHRSIFCSTVDKSYSKKRLVGCQLIFKKAWHII
jgi:hypothetical protein